jgi:iron complex outermembrane receptor protein
MQYRGHHSPLPIPLKLAVLACALLASGARANDAVFDLGAVTVLGQRAAAGAVGEEQVSSVVTRADMQRFNRDNVGDALNLLSGVMLSTNSRNEKTIAVRGFDARQVPLFIDGIPVYVPYDGYVDFNRFATADLAAIQLAKGNSAIAYGANTLGGAINLISRKPAAALEADASLGAGAVGARGAAANVGSNQGGWYAQAGLSFSEGDGFRLPPSFEPTRTEAGGVRDNSAWRDSKVSLKAGLTPGGGDEYALSYYRQDGEKGQPPSTVPDAARYWKWPYWDKESLYLVTSTGLGRLERLKLRHYHDPYANEVDTYTDNRYAVLKTSGPGAVGTGRSIYRDHTNGAIVELQSLRLDAHSLQAVAHYKADHHVETDANGTVNARFDDTLLSLGAEDLVQLAPALQLALGASRDRLRPDTVYSQGNAYSLPPAKESNNTQAGLYYDWAGAARLYATLSHKSRLPTLKDRYSQRLGSFIENPALAPERAWNYELGYQGAAGAPTRYEAALYLSEVQDKIQAVVNVSGNRSQMRNIGKVRMTGLELGHTRRFGGQLDVGANYSYTHAENMSAPATRITDLPAHKLGAHVSWHADERWELVAYGLANSARWASNMVQLGGYATLDMKAVYRPSARVALEAGASNAGDRNYQLADGFPAAGRTWFLNLNCQY